MIDFEYQMSSVANKIKFAREGAGVERVHSTRGLRPYPVGTHSFNMVNMLLIIWPEAPRKLIIACLHHDIPERLTGDMPSFAKRFGVQNTEVQEQIEHHVLETCFGVDYERDLKASLKDWLYAMDVLEFYCWVRDELSLGNYSLSGKKQDVERYIESAEFHAICPLPVMDAYFGIKDAIWIMMPDRGGR